MSQPFNDRGPFKVGEVCIIVSSPRYPELIGREVTITGPEQRWQNASNGAEFIGYECDLVYDGWGIRPSEHHLRRKRPPTTGEDMIRAMFGTPPVERRQPATAWQAQYDTAQALMKMGVRVRPGKWPVEVA